MTSRKYNPARKVEVKRAVHQPAPLNLRPPTNRKERRYLDRVQRRQKPTPGGCE